MRKACGGDISGGVGSLERLEKKSNADSWIVGESIWGGLRDTAAVYGELTS